MSKRHKTGIDPLDAYTYAVEGGYENVCKWVRKAVERHYRDLERQRTKEFPYYFEPEAAKHYARFFMEELTHYEGVVDGEPIIFEPWQWFVFGSIFGWLKDKRFKDIPIRRFRNADIIVPKKNGKSIISGGTGLYMMDWDSWPGAQCYILAKNQSHAKELGYRAAVNMVEKSDSLSDKYKINRGAMDMGIHYAGNNNAFYKPITSKADSEDGRNVHFCGPDETKDWTDFAIYNVMKNGTVNAPNSLIMTTTTAGPNQNSLGYKRQNHIENILNGTVEDDHTFGVIYSIDEEDRFDENGDEIDGYWEDPKIWEKANPNFRVSVYEDALKSMIPDAKQSIHDRISFETKHLNIWHSSTNAFIAMDKWEKCDKRPISAPFDDFEWLMHKYKGKKAYAGLDLGSVYDFTAFVVVVWMEEHNEWDVIPFFWIPKGNIDDRKNIDLIRPWVKHRYIYATPGDSTDFDFVEDVILSVAENLDIIEIPYDPDQAATIRTHLQEEGLSPVKFNQNYGGMSPAISDLEQCILDKKINHGGNPVLQWMLGNVVIQDKYDKRRFDNDRKQDKIDGIEALAMALNRAIINEGEDGNVFDGELTIV